jgi:2,4-dienoyl-CoA reductase-like NADH-dependent reductase (Old Yellow Enzyme family)
VDGGRAPTLEGAGEFHRIAVGLITEPRQAEGILAEGKADAVSLARAMLYDPRWPAMVVSPVSALIRSAKGT